MEGNDKQARGKLENVEIFEITFDDVKFLIKF